MPPRQVTCSVCKQIVPKSQTFARKDGSRACRLHPGIEEEAQEIKDKASETRQAASNILAKREDRRSASMNFSTVDELIKNREHYNTHCWICDSKGISQREHMIECIIAIKRLELRGESFDFSTFPSNIAKLVGDAPVLVCIPYYDSEDNGILRSIKDNKVRDAIPFIRYVRLCVSCIRKLGLQKRFEDLMPNPALEQLMAAMAFNAVMEPVIEELAKAAEKDEK
jgi:hypothetical protein